MQKFKVGITPYEDNEKGQYVPQGYLNAIDAIGGEPVVIYYQTPLDSLEGIVDGLDAMLFSGGDDVEPEVYGAEREPACGGSTPIRDALELALMKLCLARKLPILGICRGIQIINVALGGTLVQDVPTRYGKVHQMTVRGPFAFDHDVRVVPDTMLYEAEGGDIHVNSYHHQCVDRLGEGVIASAYAPEGFVEAIEMPKGEQFLMGVQWHPEVTRAEDTPSVRVFECFRKAILRRQS